MFSVTEFKLRYLMEKGSSRAAKLRRMKNDSHKLLITILIGNNVANVGAASLATALAIDLFGSAGVGVATGAMTLIILVLGEIGPKAFATKNAVQISLAMTPIISFLMMLFAPFVWVFDKLIGAIVPEDQNKGPTVTEEEVRDIVKLSEEEGSIKEQEQEMIENIFELDDKYASDIMTARPDVFAYDQNTMSGDVIDEIHDKGYTRIPLYEGDLDKITGILNVKDLVKVEGSVPLRQVMRPTFKVPDTQRIDRLLREFKQHKKHLAVVVNEHGTMVGIVTIEDLLEEIVGEIYDETDEEIDNLDEIKTIRPGIYLMPGKTEIDVVNETLEVDIPNEEYSTLSGFVMKNLNRIPIVDDAFINRGYRFTVKKIEENSRVALVYVEKVMP